MSGIEDFANWTFRKTPVFRMADLVTRRHLESLRYVCLPEILALHFQGIVSFILLIFYTINYFIIFYTIFYSSFLGDSFRLSSKILLLLCSPLSLRILPNDSSHSCVPFLVYNFGKKNWDTRWRTTCEVQCHFPFRQMRARSRAADVKLLFLLDLLPTLKILRDKATERLR